MTLVKKLGCLCLWALLGTASAAPLKDITFLLPAPKSAIVFAPYVLAEAQGMYAAQGVQVAFAQVPGGGMKVGAALARGEGQVGGALGDTTLLLREAGVPVKGVALLGGHAFLTLIGNRASAVTATTLKGQRLGVPSLQDISNYALQAAIAKAGLTSADVQLRAAAPADLWAALGAGKLDAMVGTVDWGVLAERGGVTLDYLPTDRFYPAMAQAIMASETALASEPDSVRAFIRASVQAMALIARDPAGAAALYQAAMPDSGFTLAEITRIFTLLGHHVYAGQKRAGAFDPATVAALQDAYLSRQLLTRRRPVSDFFTNEFLD